MLEQLDRIDWSRLTHAYGAAADVPQLIRGLVSQDPEVRQRSTYELFGNVWHQGTIFEASAYVVPALFEIIDADAENTDAIDLLTSIAGGQGYWEVHEGAIPAAPSEDQLAAERRVVAAVRQAVSPRLPDLLQYLEHTEEQIRTNTALALRFYPEHRALSLPALRSRLAVEDDEFAKETIFDSIATLMAMPGSA